MSRTRKDKKNSIAAGTTTKQKAKETFNRRYQNFKRHGADPGDYCPDCGNATDFQSGFLVCNGCGWIDNGEFELNYVA